MESDESMWALYERWGARCEVARDAGEKLRRFGIFKETRVKSTPPTQGADTTCSASTASPT
jgi:hypothetical protein